MPWFQEEAKQISRKRTIKLVQRFAAEARKRICHYPRRVLLLPPDITRAHSGAGWITEELYWLFTAGGAKVHVIPTLGQHVPHTPKQNRWMFGSVPQECIHIHDWRKGCRVIGEVPASFVQHVSGGKADWPIPVLLNRMLLEKWDLILNIGHVVPHEVLGFANHNKNYFIGLGGKETICTSHMMAACCGIENNLGCLITPLRACFNKAETDFLPHLPDAYFQVVMAYDKQDNLVHTGIYAGDNIEVYTAAARRSQQLNVTIVPPLRKVVAVMQEDEFSSTWVANKAIYRTRMAMADGGELLIIAPGLKRFGEQPEVDALIRKYGYVGREQIMSLWRKCLKNGDLKDLAHGTAHLINGSSDSRFTITYAPGGLTEKDIRAVNFNYANINEVLRRYNFAKFKNGFNIMPDGEKIYFIRTPSVGLWSTSEKLACQTATFPTI